jgi:hypothetical protein
MFTCRVILKISNDLSDLLMKTGFVSLDDRYLIDFEDSGVK